MLLTITEPITLTEAKSFLRVEHNLDDDYITSLISVARSYVEEFQGRLIAERVPAEGEEAPEYEEPAYYEKQAMLLLISHFYDNRNPVTNAKFEEVPFTISRLLYFNRKPEVLA